MQHSVTPVGLGYRYGDPVTNALAAEAEGVSTFEELVAGAESAIADISRAISRQVPVTGWAGPTADRIQVALGPEDLTVPANGAPSRFPWALAIGGAAVAAGLIYLATRKG